MNDATIIAIMLFIGAIVYGIHEWSRVTLIRAQLKMGDGVASVVSTLVQEIGHCVRFDVARTQVSLEEAQKMANKNQ